MHFVRKVIEGIQKVCVKRPKIIAEYRQCRADSILLKERE